MKREKPLIGLCQSCICTLGFSGKSLEDTPKASHICDHCRKTSTIFYVTEAAYEIAKVAQFHKDPVTPLSFMIENSRVTCTYRTGQFMIYLDKTFLYSTPHVKERDEFLGLLMQRLCKVVQIKSCDHTIVHWITIPEENLYRLVCFFCGAKTNVVAYSRVAQSGPFRITFSSEKAEK